MNLRSVFGKARRQAPSRRRGHSFAAEVQPLEGRQLLTSGYMGSGGQLVIYGSETAETIAVGQDTATKQLRVVSYTAGQITYDQWFDGSKVANVYVNSMGGDDTIMFQTSLPVIAEGWTGNDIINAAWNLAPATVYGDSSYYTDMKGDDTIYGAAGQVNNLIYGGAGNDKLYGYGGNDTIFGGVGDDTILSNGGDDTIYGDDGSDVIDSGDGNDLIYGGAGNDAIEGRAGDNKIYGGAGNDTIYGGIGADTIEGEDGNDQINGWAGNDTLRGGAGDDRISGDEGNDFIYGGAGNDYCYGFDGNDYIEGNSGNDGLYGGEGDDRLGERHSESGGRVSYGEDGDDFLDGGYGNDTLRGGNGNDVLYGGDGNDFFGYVTTVWKRRAGSSEPEWADQVFGEPGDDSMSGGRGNDVMFGGMGSDTLNGNDGDDVLHAGTNYNPLDFRTTTKPGDYNVDGSTDYLTGGDGKDLMFFHTPQWLGNQESDWTYGLTNERDEEYWVDFAKDIVKNVIDRAVR